MRVSIKLELHYQQNFEGMIRWILSLMVCEKQKSKVNNFDVCYFTLALGNYISTIKSHEITMILKIISKNSCLLRTEE